MVFLDTYFTLEAIMLQLAPPVDWVPTTILQSNIAPFVPNVTLEMLVKALRREQIDVRPTVLSILRGWRNAGALAQSPLPFIRIAIAQAGAPHQLRSVIHSIEQRYFSAVREFTPAQTLNTLFQAIDENLCTLQGNVLLLTATETLMHHTPGLLGYAATEHGVVLDFHPLSKVCGLPLYVLFTSDHNVRILPQVRDTRRPI